MNPNIGILLTFFMYFGNNFVSDNKHHVLIWATTPCQQSMFVTIIVILIKFKAGKEMVL